MRQKYVFVNWLRAISCLLILLCHVVGQSGNAYIRMSGQLFNIGVFLFFIMSGFCFGIQDEIVNPLKWYLKRITKIFIPYLLFLIIL
ncbi:MAG: acyltransferase family protein [Clostridia bacterium]|nr:acyltransferase family protein [Clostridia bacterium]